MNRIPYEIFEKITDYLQYNDILNLSKIDKKRDSCIDKKFWVRRCLIDYPNINILKYTQGFVKYTYLYKNYCNKCIKKTTRYNIFFKEYICQQCEKNNIKYKTISKTNALEEFLLKETEINNLQFVSYRNRFNFDKPIKMYLLSDIEKIHDNKYQDKNKLKILILKKAEAKITRKMKSLLKWSIFRTMMFNLYSLDIHKYEDYIEEYSSGSQGKYLRNIGKKINNNLMIDLTNKYIELDFIFKYSGYKYDYWKEYGFDRCLEEMLILNNFITTVINSLYNNNNLYILNKISSISNTTEYKEKLLRKIKIDKYLGYKCDYASIKSQAYNYIFYNKENIETVVSDIIEDNFMLSDRFDIHTLSWKLTTTNKTKFDIYKEELIIYRNNGGELPEWAKIKYDI